MRILLLGSSMYLQMGVLVFLAMKSIIDNLRGFNTFAVILGIILVVGMCAFVYDMI